MHAIGEGRFQYCGCRSSRLGAIGCTHSKCQSVMLPGGPSWGWRPPATLTTTGYSTNVVFSHISHCGGKGTALLTQ
eukprot:6479775-Amphidinium_carterae.1